jgi:hypothetical protein
MIMDIIEELNTRFTRLAKADFETNNGYPNAPYKAYYKGQLYIGRIKIYAREHRGTTLTDATLIVERPVTRMCDFGVEMPK